MNGLTVVIPALNAAGTLARTITALAGAPVLVVDGGSTDATVAIAQAYGAGVMPGSRGRGSQLAAGIAATNTPWLLLLHADTRVAPGWRAAAAAHMAAHPQMAGYFGFTLDSADPRARRLERLVGWRCRALALPYGDQGLLARRDLLEAVGGVQPLPLMEDVDLARRLGRHRLRALDHPVLTSAARWERDGWIRRSARNLLCLALYRAGMPLGLVRRLYG